MWLALLPKRVGLPMMIASQPDRSYRSACGASRLRATSSGTNSKTRLMTTFRVGLLGAFSHEFSTTKGWGLSVVVPSLPYGRVMISRRCPFGSSQYILRPPSHVLI